MSENHHQESFFFISEFELVLEYSRIESVAVVNDDET
jgi:hypothetical protein